jgi:hypothetical protein
MANALRVGDHLKERLGTRKPSIAAVSSVNAMSQPAVVS